VKGHYRLLALGLLSAIIILAGCVSRGDYQDLENVVTNQARVIGNLKNYNHDLQLKYDRAVSDNPLVEEENARLKRELGVYKEQYAKMKDLWENRPAQKAPEGMKFEPWGIRAESRVLFDSGEHKLKATGKQALKAVSATLKALRIQVEGHTDSDRVVRTKKRYPHGNLQLSGERALEVANFLIKECGLNPKNVSYCGYGEYKPIASNDSPAGKARNRRVDIRVQPVKQPKP